MKPTHTNKNIRLYNADCLEVLASLPDKSIHLVLCDPPYGTTDITWDTVIPFDKIWAELGRVCKPNAPIVLFGASIFTARMIGSQRAWFRRSMVWAKSKCGSPLLAKFRPMITHEDIMVFTCGGGEPLVENPITLHSKEYPAGDLNTVLEFASEGDTEHPTQKPVPLLKWLIHTYSNEGDIVLDFTMGSGTTGVAAVKTKRRFIGIELDEKYFKVCKRRMDHGIADGAPKLRSLF